jgi:hypothetical protein
VIRVHSLVGEVDNRVRGVGEAMLDWPSTLQGLMSLDLRGTMPFHTVSGGTARGFTTAPRGIPRRISSQVELLCGAESALHPLRMRWPRRKKTAPGLKVILLLKMMVKELALIDDTQPTWRASYRCFVSDHTPGGTLVVLLGRMVSRIVTRWFVLEHERETSKFQ